MVVATVALLAPAAAASATEVVFDHENASCSNGKGGNDDWTGHTYNGKGNVTKAEDCLFVPPPPPADEEPTEPIGDGTGTGAEPAPGEGHIDF